MLDTKVILVLSETDCKLCNDPCSVEKIMICYDRIKKLFENIREVKNGIKTVHKSERTDRERAGLLRSSERFNDNWRPASNSR